MTTTQFFRSCRDLVRVRWTLFIKKAGALHLILVIDRVNENYAAALAPIVAVARDRFGSSIKDPNDIHAAAEALCLSRQNATLITAAAFSDAPPDKRVADVRHELIAATRNRSLLFDLVRS